MWFEKYSIPFLVLIIGIYAFSAVPDVFEWYDFSDTITVKQRINDLKLDSFDVYLKYILLKPGVDIGLPKLIPFFESIILLMVVYFLAVKISGMKFAGLLAVVIVVTSRLFSFYDTSLPYDNSWIIFLLLAIYYEKSKFSPVFFVASIFCKPLTVLYIPSMIFLKLRDKKLGIPFIIIGLVSLIGISSYYDYFSMTEFLEGMYDNIYWFYADPYLLVMIPVVSVALVIARKYGYKNTMMPLAFMINSIFMSGIVEGFTGMYNQGYRYIPMVIFLALGVSVFFQSKKPTFLKNTLRLK